MAASKTIGGINVNITATTQQFAKNIAGAQRMLGNFGKSIKGLVFNLKTLGAALAIGGATKMITDQYKAIDALEELSQKVGVSTDKLAGLQIAAQDAGVSNALLEKSLVKVGNAYGMSGDEALRKWIDKTSKLTTQHQKLAAATEMFGAKGADMVRFLTGGVEAIDQAQKAADAMGMSVSQANAVAIGAMMQKWDHFKGHVVGVFRTIAAESWPYVNGLLDGVQSFVDNMGGGKGVGTFIVDVLTEMAKQVVDGINRMVSGVVGLVADTMHFTHDWRRSGAGKLAGFGYSSKQAEADAFNSALKMGSYAMEIAGNKPSDRIQQFVDNAKKQAAAAAAAMPENSWLSGIMNSVTGSGNFKNARDIGSSLWGGLLGGVGSMPGLMAKANWAAATFVPQKVAGATQKPALSFAESGSADSYRQQAAIRKQSENIEKKQLGAQEKMVVALMNIDKKLVPMRAAGFA